MTAYLVLTAIGEDQPGLVEALAEVIADNSGNWLESSMSQLAGKFAGILRVSVADDEVDNLVTALKGVSDRLKLVIERVDIDIKREVSRTVELNLIGNDRPGIVREISHALTSFSVNVEKLTTECAPAPMSSDVLFKATAILTVPKELELEFLKHNLERLADDIIVEVRLN
ncbi:MAG: glycine cleavage system protein R [Gammaproteobacteria bacterium]|nr:glycine cleavage system protein R [Gammaproteobacteria bacterium]|tara:strand:- start:654 stop:1166 length:513 start_codon:yes stop_codon:yes gene_type:complete